MSYCPECAKLERDLAALRQRHAEDQITIERLSVKLTTARDTMALDRQRHAEAVEAAFREGRATRNTVFVDANGPRWCNEDEAWDASKAKARLT